MADADNNRAVSELHRFARMYAEIGWAVFPLSPRTKVPLPGSRGFQDASTERAQIDAWWRATPQANIGIATGRVSNLVVLDVDTDDDHGGTLEEAGRVCGGSVPPTRMARTGSGGYHLYFRFPTMLPDGLDDIRPSVEAIGKGLDIRGSGGYVAAPPSVHPSGNLYTWENRETWLLTPTPLLEALAEATKRSGSSGSVVGTAETDEVYITSGRNNFLTKQAGRLRRMGYAQEVIEASLLALNTKHCDPPLTEREVLRTARSVSRYQPAAEVNAVAQHQEQEEAIAKRAAREAERAQGQERRARTRRGDGGTEAVSVPDTEQPAVPAAPVPDVHRQEQQEQTILGALLVDAELPPEARADLLVEVATVLRAQHFYSSAVRMVFSEMLLLEGEKRPYTAVHLDGRLAGREGYPGMEALLAWRALAPTNLDFASSLRDLCEQVLEAYRQRLLLDIGQRMQAQVMLGGTSSTTLAVTYEQSLRAVQLVVPPTGNGLSEHIAAYRAELAEWRAHPGKVLRGVSTGVYDLDKATAGAMKGDLWVIGGRASMGKTAYAISMALHNALAWQDEYEAACIGLPTSVPVPRSYVGIISAEMRGPSVIHRLVGMLTRIPPFVVMVGHHDDGTPVDDTKVEAAITQIEGLPLKIMDAQEVHASTNGHHGLLTPEAISQQVLAWNQMVAPGRVEVLFVDYLQMLAPPAGAAHENRERQVAAISASLKGLAMSFRIPVILLAQLNRGVEARTGRLPQMSDIRESGGVEQDADVILLLFRRDYYVERGIEVPTDQPNSSDGVADIKLEKNRNGAVGIQQAYFDRHVMRYWGWDAERKLVLDYHGNHARWVDTTPVRAHLPTGGGRDIPPPPLEYTGPTNGFQQRPAPRTVQVPGPWDDDSKFGGFPDANDE